MRYIRRRNIPLAHEARMDPQPDITVASLLAHASALDDSASGIHAFLAQHAGELPAQIQAQVLGHLASLLALVRALQADLVDAVPLDLDPHRN